MASLFDSLKQHALLLGLALTALSVALPAVWRYQDGRREISIDVIEQLPLSRQAALASRGLNVKFGDKVVVDPYVSRITIKNSGNSAITREDFDGPITLTLSDGAVVLTAEVDDKRPADLRVAMAPTEKSVEIAPLLLNPDDEFTIGILSSGSKPNIAGAHHVRNAARPETRLNEAISGQRVELKMKSVGLMFWGALISCFIGGMAARFITYCFQNNNTLWVLASLVAVGQFIVLLSLREPFRLALGRLLPGETSDSLVLLAHVGSYLLLTTLGAAHARKMIANFEKFGIRYSS